MSAPTLDEVNQKLLERLDKLLDSAGAEEILDITEAIAKLNASYKGNDNFSKPESESERMARAQQDVLLEALKKGPTCDIADGDIV